MHVQIDLRFHFVLVIFILQFDAFLVTLEVFLEGHIKKLEMEYQYWSYKINRKMFQNSFPFCLIRSIVLYDNALISSFFSYFSSIGSKYHIKHSRELPIRGIIPSKKRSTEAKALDHALKVTIYNISNGIKIEGGLCYM